MAGSVITKIVQMLSCQNTKVGGHRMLNSKKTLKKVRGGLWLHNLPSFFQCAHYNYRYSDYNIDFYGFRCTTLLGSNVTQRLVRIA